MMMEYKCPREGAGREGGRGKGWRERGEKSDGDGITGGMSR